MKYEFINIEMECWGPWTDPKGEAEGNKGGFILKWVAKGIGFGELTFVLKDNGQIECDNECMSEEFCKEVLYNFLIRTKMRWGCNESKDGENGTEA